MPRLLTAVVAAAALTLMLAAQLYAQDIPDRWMPEPPKPPKMPVPIREPPARPPIGVPVELKGYIYAVVVDPVDPAHMPGRTEYYFSTVDGRFYRLELGGAKLHLCSHFADYVGTGKAVIVKGYLRPVLMLPYTRGYGGYILFATEVRDPAHPRCR